jgi:hypothetical protein
MKRTFARSVADEPGAFAEACEKRFSADAVYAPLIERIRTRHTGAAAGCAAPTMSLGSTVAATVPR